MKYLLLLFLAMLSPHVGAENLQETHLVGSWIQEFEIVEGEAMTLEISPNLEAIFTRDFPESEDQRFNGTVSFADGIWLMDFDSEGEFGYKVVVSGWRQNLKTALFGTMYMYRKGELYNGIPVSFRKDS